MSYDKAIIEVTTKTPEASSNVKNFVEQKNLKFGDNFSVSIVDQSSNRNGRNFTIEVHEYSGEYPLVSEGVKRIKGAEVNDVEVFRGESKFEDG